MKESASHPTLADARGPQVTRRAYSRIGFRVIRGQGELVGDPKNYDKYKVFDDIIDHSSEYMNSNR